MRLYPGVHRALRRSNLSLIASLSACLSTAVAAMSTTTSGSRVIDSHLHVWANADESSKGFPYAQDPPDSLKDLASTDELLRRMDRSGVDGALIVQPINHKFDHSYVIQSIKQHPDKFKGMMLHDPSLDSDAAVQRLEELALRGFVGVRFNPYLWPKIDDNQWSPMSRGAGLAVYKRCADLRMPVGVMCFQGLQLHYDDIVSLLDSSPDTVMILDHFGFASVENPGVFEKLLSLAKYPQVYVKISALFRLDDPSPYDAVYEKRFRPLLETFTADRLMYGSDFPFVLEQPESYGMVNLVSTWLDNCTESDKRAVLGGTAERVFGPWIVPPGTKTEL